MALKLGIIPKDSYIRHWLSGLSALETPRSYLLLVAMSAVGSLLKRNCWIDQERWKVYPNLSCFLIGPSGIGKDTAIDEGVDLVERFNGNVLYGRTVEKQAVTMAKAEENPSCWLVPGPEATAFFGRKDYQQGKLEFWTDILTTKAKYDYSSMSNDKMTIQGPTVTMMLGSTASWLQRNMPAGSLEGGFFPRFMVLNENFSAKFVPLIKYGSNKVEQQERAAQMDCFYSLVEDVVVDFANQPGEIILRQEAIDYYTNWYYNRFDIFPAGVREYANRSRDQLLRLAMLSGILRGRRYVDREDMVFGDLLLQYTMSTLEEAIKPQSVEQQCQVSYEFILGKLGPSPRSRVLNVLRKSYDHTTILKAEAQLLQSNLIAKDKTTGHISITDSGD